MKKALIALAVMGLSTFACADVQLTGMGVHIGSHHFPAQQWNNSNPGVYLKADVAGPAYLSGSYVLGTYYNSERNQSAYLARVYPLFRNVDVAVGVISGYKRAAVLPLVVPSVRLDLWDNWVGRLSVLPKVEKSGSWVAHLSVERNF